MSSRPTIAPSGNSSPAAVTTFTRGQIVVNGVPVAFPALTNADGTSFFVSNVGSTPGSLAAPALTTYTHTVGTFFDDVFFRAVGAGSVLDLHNLTTLNGGNDGNDRVNIQAQSGGKVDLSGLTQALDPATEITCLGTREGLEARLVPEAGLPLEEDA